MRNLSNLLFAFAAVAAAGTSADAKPRRIVVVDFDGLPRTLADNGRANVLNGLEDQYDLINTKKWESARAEVPGRGQLQWQQAAKKSGVDAVVEGWVNTEGRHHTLTVQVRDATTGIEIDSVSVKMGDKGLSAEATKSLMKQLDDVLTWIDGDATSWDVHSTLRPVDVERPPLGGHNFNRGHALDLDDGDSDSDSETAHRKSRGHDHGCRHDDDCSDRRDRDDDHGDDRRGNEDRRGNDDRRGDDDRRGHDDRRSSDERRGDDDRDGDHGDRHDRDKPGLTRTAQATPAPASPNDVMPFFAPDSTETEVVAQTAAPRIVKPAPKFFVEGGAFVTSRGMTFAHDPVDSQMGTPDYPAQGLAGISLGASVYPMPTEKLSNDPSGIGFSFHLQKSVGSLFSAFDPDGNTYGDYTIDHTAYEGGIHYRIPTDLLSFDGEVNYGKFGYIIAGLPGGVQIPDVDYSYLGIGGTLDLKVTDRTRAGFGAHYMYLLDAGDVSDETWYGSGSASGLDLEAHFQVPITDAMFIRGQVDYRRVSMDFEESGDVSSMLELGSIVDSSIGGAIEIGVQW
jgi:hypothetical protein